MLSAVGVVTFLTHSHVDAKLTKLKKYHLELVLNNLNRPIIFFTVRIFKEKLK